MACYEGESLKDKIKRGPLDKDEAVDIAVQVAQGMTKAHQKGIVHRDLKPANILITNEGVAKIVDFGLAKLAGQVRLTREGTTIGTVAFMSPEQAKGEAVDQRTDIWSLGVVLYEMLSGILPFKGDYEQTLIHSILHDEPAPISRIRKDLPAGLGDIVVKSLQKNPADRYQSMDELLEDLKAIAEGLKPVRAKAGFLSGKILGLKKKYAYPALACLIVLAAVAVLFLFPKRGQAFDSIAVLPFVNQSGDAEQDIFCDSVHRELIMQLSRIKSLRTVIAKQTMMAFKGTTKKSSEIAKELNVAAIISGEARRAGDKVLINFELIDGRNDKLLGGDNVQGDYRDILTVQSEAALAIAREIRSALTPEETRVLSEKKQVDQKAYDEYIKGTALLEEAGLGFSAAKLEESLAHFNRAVEIDPQFARGYAGQALAYDFLGSSFGPAKEYFSKAKAAALKARDLDDSLPEPPFVLADILFAYDWDFESGVRESKRILELYPSYAMAHAAYANNIAHVDRQEEVLFHCARARELDPLDFTSATVVFNALLVSRQYEKSTELARELIALDINKPIPHNLASWGLFYEGRFEEAWIEYQKAIEPGYQEYPLERAWLLAKSGKTSSASDLVDKFLGKKKVEPPEHLAGIAIAHIYAIVGDKDEAFRWLDWLYEKRSSHLGSLEAQSDFDNLRFDPRYADLLKKVRSKDVI